MKLERAAELAKEIVPDGMPVNLRSGEKWFLGSLSEKTTHQLRLLISSSILAACEAESKLAAAALEPSPCGVAGHRMVDWVEGSEAGAIPSECHGDISIIWKHRMPHCLACQREHAVAAAMAEKCAELCEAKANYAMDKAAGKDKLSAQLLGQLAGIMKDTAERIRSFSPAGVLEVHDQAVRMAERERCINLVESHYEMLVKHGFKAEAVAVMRACFGIAELTPIMTERLAALRASPQLTAVKEPTNG